MKLNHDCIREVLLTIEKQMTLNSTLVNTDINNSIKNFSSDEIEYVIRKLSEAGYIDCEFTFEDYFVKNMTWEGHQFLDTIRNDQVWKSTKDHLKKFGSFSIPVIQQLATSISKKILDLE